MHPATSHSLDSVSAPEERRSGGLSFRFAIAGCVLLVAIVAALYFPALHHGFLNYDDDDYVVANPHVQGGLNLRSLHWAFTNIDAAQYQPITWISHIVDCDLFGLNPAGHHLSNVVLHGLNAALLFLVLAWITGAPGRSLAVAALFAVHPVNVENVAWVAERKTLVCTFFTLATVAAYALYAQRQNWRRYALVVVTFALALGSKSMAVTLPIALLIFDYWPLERSRRMPGVSTRSLLLEKVPLLAMAVAVSLLTLHAEEKGAAITHFRLTTRVANAIFSCVAYLGKLFWPADLTVITPYPAHGHGLIVVVACAAFLIVVTVFVIAVRERAPYLPAGWLLYLVSIAPVSGIIPVGHSAVSDRFLYTPELGVFVALVWLVAAQAQPSRVRPAMLWFVTAGIVTAYASVTALYLPAWKNSYTLFSRAEKLSPVPDTLIENNLGQGLVEIGRSAEAVPHYRAAIALAPQLPLPHYNLGNSLLSSGDPADAASEFEKALDGSPDRRLRLRALNNLGVAQLQLRDFDRAEASFTAALALDPDSARSLTGRGQARISLANSDGAIDDLERAAKLDPDAFAYFWLGKAYIAKGNRASALGAFRHALDLRPNFTDAKQAIEALNDRQPR